MPGEKLYTDLAEHYDRIDAKSEEDLRRDARHVTRLVRWFKTAESDALLDVGCGTGGHLRHLEDVFDCHGVDANEGVLEIAREKASKASYGQADMRSLDLDDTFGAIICLFSTIGYAGTRGELRATLEGFHEHLEPGGIAIVEPYASPSEYGTGDGLGEGEPTMMTYDGDDVKISRHQLIKREGTTAILDVHYLVSERGADEVRYVEDHHELGLYEIEEVVTAMEAVGFDPVEFHEAELSDGAIVGVR